ncbi:MAG: DUF3471 domain-containing protein, partial [Bryobacteraceae bacterium]
LTNLSGSPLAQVLTHAAFDRLLALEPVDWSARFKADREKGEAAQAEAAKKRLSARKPGTRPSHDLKDYAGEYEHPAYGSLRIEVEGDALKATFHGMTLRLEHYHFDVFDGDSPMSPGDRVLFTFVTNGAGNIDRVELPLESAVKPIVYTRLGS